MWQAAAGAATASTAFAAFTQVKRLAPQHKHVKTCSVVQEWRQASVMGVCLLFDGA